MTLVELRQRRAEILAKMRAIHDTGRELSEQQQRDWDRLHGEAQVLGQRIQRAEFLEPNERALDQPDPRARQIDPLRSYGGDSHLLARGDRMTPEAREQSEAFRNFILTGERSGLQQRTLGTGAGSGVLVPLHISRNIIEAVEALENVRRPRAPGVPGASVMEILGDQDVPAITDATALRLTEAATDSGGIVATDPTFSGVSLRPNLLVCRSDVKWHLLNRGAINVDQELIRSFSRSIAKKENAEWYLGDGTGEPQGLLTITPAKTAASATTFTEAELQDVFYALGTEFLNDSVWLVSPTAHKIISALEDTAGTRLFAPDRSDGVSRLWGRPVIMDGGMPAVAASAVPVALVNLAEGYLIGEERQLTVLRDEYTRADSAEVRIFVHKFNDGRVRNTAAVKLLKMAAA